VGLICTDMYVISSGLDDKLCVWERKRGHLLYTVEMDSPGGTSMSMLCNNFLVTGGQVCNAFNICFDHITMLVLNMRYI